MRKLLFVFTLFCFISQSQNIAYVDSRYILENIPITAVLGDQQASLFGQQCFDRGSVKNTYGTGCFALSNTGDDIIYSNLSICGRTLLFCATQTER